MKQKISLGSSISVLTGAVIAILALVRGPAQTVLLLTTFALWGLWVLLALLRPAWQANRAYRCREERAEKMQEAFSGINVAELLLRHVNYRISDHLKSAYPGVRWEWTMNDPALFIARGGTGRICLYGVPDYEYADVTLDQRGTLNCARVKVVPMQNNGTPPNQPAADPQVWYELEGRAALDTLIADLRSRGHSSLSLNEDGSITFQAETGGGETGCFTNLPGKVYWPRLADVLEQDGLSADVQDSRIVVSW